MKVNSHDSVISLRQAEEISKNLVLCITDDSLKVFGFCKYKIHIGPFKKKLENEVEGYIINTLNIPSEKAKIISNFNGANEGCGREKTFLF